MPPWSAFPTSRSKPLEHIWSIFFILKNLLDPPTPADIDSLFVPTLLLEQSIFAVASVSPVIVNALQPSPVQAAGPLGQFPLPWLWPSPASRSVIPFPATLGHQDSTCLCPSSSCQVCYLKPVCETLRSDSGTPGLSPWLLFLLCPRSHPRGLIQALEFKYHPPAQGSCVYVFSSGLSAEPWPLPPAAHSSPQDIQSTSSAHWVWKWASCLPWQQLQCWRSRLFLFFFLLLSHLQSDRNSLLALPSESVQSHAPYTSLWLLPGCSPATSGSLSRPSDSFSASVPPSPSSQCSSWSNALTMSLKSCYSFAQKPMAVSLWSKVKFFAVSVLQGPARPGPCFLSDINSLLLSSACHTERLALLRCARLREAGFSVSSGPSPWVLVLLVPTNSVTFFLSLTTRVCSLTTSSVPLRAVAQPWILEYTAWVSFFYQYLSPSYILSNLLACVYYLPSP